MNGPRVTALLDTHVLHWWTTDPDHLSPAAAELVEGADELAVSGITWFELAWLATHDRIHLAIPIDAWLSGLAAQVRTIGITPAVARTAAALPAAFPGDPADRLIYATAVERGWPLVTKDRRLRQHPHPREIAVW